MILLVIVGKDKINMNAKGNFPMLAGIHLLRFLFSH